MLHTNCSIDHNYCEPGYVLYNIYSDCLLIIGWWMCSVDGDKVGWAPPSYLKKCEKNVDGESDSDEEYIGLPESCEQPLSHSDSSYTFTYKAII